jgi:hypothetical protein
MTYNIVSYIIGLFILIEFQLSKYQIYQDVVTTVVSDHYQYVLNIVRQNVMCKNYCSSGAFQVAPASYHRNTEKTNNLKMFGINQIKGPKRNSQNRLRSPILERGEH